MKDGFIIKFARLLPDKLYLSLKFFKEFGRFPHWNNPQTFNEKIQWLKIYDRKPEEYTTMVDKYAAKQYVAAKIGVEYVIPTFGIWDRPEDIEWDKLPDQFVLKTTHGGGSTGVIVCRDKANFDKTDAIRKLNESLRTDLYVVWREWPYKNVSKRVIAEKYIEPDKGTNDLTDYKWYCFNGIPKYCQVIQNRSTEETIDFFDAKWNHQEFIGLNPCATMAANEPACPSDLDGQIRIATILSKGLCFSRIDLYSIAGRTYFGEITFYPNSGMGRFTPAEWNKRLGDLLKLPSNEDSICS